jgi:hypothetical protein
MSIKGFYFLKKLSETIIMEDLMLKPQKTIIAYKLFAIKKKQPGKIFPLFIGAKTATRIGEWIQAEFIPTKGFSHRPGWHVGESPIANHLKKKDGTYGDRVWAQVEIPNDINWQEEANRSSTKDIRNKIPIGGHYEFPRPKSQGGKWLIAGAIKVIKVLEKEEVEKILANNYL